MGFRGRKDEGTEAVDAEASEVADEEKVMEVTNDVNGVRGCSAPYPPPPAVLLLLLLLEEILVSFPQLAGQSGRFIWAKIANGMATQRRIASNRTILSSGNSASTVLAGGVTGGVFT